MYMFLSVKADKNITLKGQDYNCASSILNSSYLKSKLLKAIESNSFEACKYLIFTSYNSLSLIINNYPICKCANKEFQHVSNHIKNILKNSTLKYCVTQAQKSLHELDKAVKKLVSCKVN